MAYNYSKLRGKIREIYGTQENFSEELGISSASLSAKLNNHVDFSQTEISAIVKLLEIPAAELSLYFFLPQKPNNFGL